MRLKKVTHRYSSVVLAVSSVALLVAGCQRQMPPDRAADYSTYISIRASLGGAAGGAAEADTANASQPTGWATLTGSFQLDGPAPPRQPLTIEKEVDICAPGGNRPLSETLIVDSSGGIKNVAIYVTSKLPSEEPWTHPSAMPAEGDVVFDQKQCIFLTHVVGITTGQTLLIKNSDPTGHNVNLRTRNNTPLDQLVPSGKELRHQFSREEREPFSASCAVHPWMQAWILTRENGYFAVSRDDGTFEIPNLPTGVELEFRVWQEKSGFLQDVVVDGSAAKWSKGRFQRILDPSDEASTQLNVKINASAFN